MDTTHYITFNGDLGGHFDIVFEVFFWVPGPDLNTLLGPGQDFAQVSPQMDKQKIFYEFVCVEKMSKTKMPRDLGHRNRSVIKLA